MRNYTETIILKLSKEKERKIREKALKDNITIEDGFQKLNELLK